MNRPFNASVSIGILDRIRRFARSAITAGSAVPLLSIKACSINRPDTPVMSVATEDSLIPADSNSFSNRWISRVRPWVMWVRALVRSRSCRIGSGGTNDARSRPWAPRSASQAASDTSDFRPGTFFTSWALTSKTSKSASRT